MFGGGGGGGGRKRKDLSVPPGFVSLTSFVLRKLPGPSYDGDDDRLWNFGDRAEAGQNESRREVECINSQKPEHYVAEHGNTDPCVLDDAPLFCPDDEEFLDTLGYIARIRPDAEASGICQILPASSWKTPCLLTESSKWENSMFTPKVQRIGFVDKDHASTKVRQVGSAPEHSLKSFKKYADEFKENLFRKDGSMNRELKSSVSGVESEFQSILKDPTTNIEVLFGDDIDSKSFGSGFPTTSDSQTMSDDSCCVECSWNLNNTPQLPGSLLCFEDYGTSSILGTRLRVGMCFSTSLWKSEDHRLYSIRYLHFGNPVIWYCVPGRCRSKFEAVARKYSINVPPEQHELNARWVSRLSPSALKAEGIAVYRCVQCPGEFVIIFPGSYVMGLDTGFNFLESANFAPLDWLPHGQTDAEFCRGKRRKTSISHDKLLLGAVIKAVRAHWDVKVLMKQTNDNLKWQAAMGKDGILAKSFKYRVKWESLRKEYLCNPYNVRTMDKSFDTNRKRECVVCFCDLHLSAVGCPCSDDRFSCLSHSKQLCSCGWHAKFFLFRYDIGQLKTLEEALEGRLVAMIRAREVLGLTSSFNRGNTLSPHTEPRLRNKNDAHASSPSNNSADGTRAKVGKTSVQVDSGDHGKDAPN
ncbi:hypothetical protein MLD38_030080 [Melastoma candidum]|uniref:Uncharacterized protein n=1 Tax=Melastoma candidum TaxID=119954 RepID=A0ACB9MMN5_9MYRT|nr:hypothetical protein MLD38_030080 [Melastoma candidum]